MNRSWNPVGLERAHVLFTETKFNDRNNCTQVTLDCRTWVTVAGLMNQDLEYSPEKDRYLFCVLYCT